QGVAHVQGAGHIGRRNDDRIGRLGSGGVGVEIALLEPEAGPLLLDLRRFVCFRKVAHCSAFSIPPSAISSKCESEKRERYFFTCCSLMMISASSGTTSQAIFSMISRESAREAAGSPPANEISRSTSA